MKPSPLNTYVAAVATVAAGTMAYLGSEFPLTEGSAWIGALIWPLVVGPQTVAFPKQRVQISMSDCFIFTGMLVYGPLAAIAAAFIGTLGSALFSERKPTPTQAVFNLSAVPLSAGVAAMVFHVASTATGHLVSVLLSACVFAVVNTLLVSVVLRLERQVRVRDVFSSVFVPFLGSVVAAAGAGALLAVVSESRGPGLAVGGTVAVCFVLSRLVSAARQRSPQEAVA